MKCKLLLSLLLVIQALRLDVQFDFAMRPPRSSHLFLESYSENAQFQLRHCGFRNRSFRYLDVPLHGTHQPFLAMHTSHIGHRGLLVPQHQIAVIHMAVQVATLAARNLYYYLEARIVLHDVRVHAKVGEFTSPRPNRPSSFAKRQATMTSIQPKKL